MRGAIGLLLLFGALATALPGTARAAVFNPETFTLENGLQVVVVPNRRAPVVVHMVWYKVGAADEPPGKSGIAHFLEHLMFKGTKTVPPGEFSRIVARNGGTDNAFTAQDYTGYFQRVARDRLELVMELEADRMHNLVLSDEVVLPELGVVLEERRSRVDNNPAARLSEQVRTALYLHHPYRIPIIGWQHEIERLTKDDAMAFYRRFYWPNNAILVVAGDISVDELRPLAEKYYGPVPRGPEIVRKRVEEPPRAAAARLEKESPHVGQPRWSRTYLAPSRRTAEGREAHALELLAEILGGGATSRLYRTLVIEEAIAASAGSWYSPHGRDSGAFGLHGTPRGGNDVAALEAAIEAEVETLLKDGVTEDEVARARDTLLAGAIYARDSLGAAPNILGRTLASGGTIEDIERWPERIEAVTAEDVNAAARALFVPVNAVTSVLRPARGDGPS